MSPAAAFRRHWTSSHFFCHDLPTKPCPEIGKVLVTGASGYVGGRLVNELLARGYQVRVLVRTPSPEDERQWPGAEIAVADARDIINLRKALEGIHTAYYLIHSLLCGPKEFEAADILAAQNFRDAVETNDVQRVIYLGGLGDVRGVLSKHLQSRAQVADTLREGRVKATVLRAAIIIGSGSASYELIEHLVKNCPVIPIPKFARKRCQPIAIRDVIKYLVGVLETPETAGKVFDIGGPDILSYREMMQVLSDLLKIKRFYPVSPIAPIGLYAYFGGLVTPVPAQIIACLIEGLRHEVICQNSTIRDHLPFDTLPYREALILAMSREEQDRVYTRWSDAYPRDHNLVLKLHELEPEPKYTAQYALSTAKSPEALFETIRSIGGKQGWFHNNWMWRLRGLLDRMLMGIGASRGRKSQSELKINDVIDFWRVEDIQPNRRLLLRAEMKLPGRAWLEFAIEREGESNRLSVRPYFDTKTLWGRLYWYTFLPFHHFIFTLLIEDIERRS